jgi:hypothetical protein
MYASASISVFCLTSMRRQWVVIRTNMAAFRALVNSRFPDDSDDTCMSCLETTKYCCLHCKFPLCNKCSVPEENEETRGWKAGKTVAYCEQCAKDVRENGGKSRLGMRRIRRPTAPDRYITCCQVFIKYRYNNFCTRLEI